MDKKHSSEARVDANRGLENFLEGEFAQFNRLFEAGNEAALFETLAVCFNERECRGTQRFLGPEPVSIPRWALEAVLDRLRRYLLELASEGTGRSARWATRFKQDMIDFDRWNCIVEGREHKVKWGEVYDRAAKILEGGPSKGSPETLRKSYKRVKKRMQSNPSRYAVFKYLR